MEADLFDGYEWLEMSEAEVLLMPVRLVTEEADASIKQYPSFNERFRRFLSAPRFLKCLDRNRTARGYVCFISLNFAAIQCGFCIDGPVLFGGEPALESQAKSLAAWFKKQGYAFIRFSHRERKALEPFACLPQAARENPLPFILRYGSECVIDLKLSDAEMLASFQKIARKEIRTASDAGCVVKRSSDINEFLALWPMFQRRAREKGFRLLRRERYESMFALSPREDLIRLYIGCYGDRSIFPVLIIRDRSEAYGMVAAIDKKAMGDAPSPGCLVHWTIMRDCRDLGCVRYNLGQPTGSVYALKRKFHPWMTPPPFTVTVILSPGRYRFWVKVIMRSMGAALRGVKMIRV